jgi:hypothetical protein
MNHEFISYKKPFSFLTYLIALFLWLYPSYALSKTEHQVYFPNTAYELNIYRIYGKNPGKTLLLIGGIQGNEPGGFLSADLYADMSLEKGNLIVVPRANFYSIITNERGPHGDMNRKFTHEDNSSSMEDEIVTILKQLISESDFLLNLHDGAGYYYPEYIDNWRNPDRFGQSIIADSDKFQVPGTDEVIPLGEIARQVIEEVNKDINNDLYKFHFMNTRTGEEYSTHKEQRKSATYYALNGHHIPAFGVETSKFLPSTDLKVWFHNLVINAFMERFGIIPQSPGLELETPSLKYIVVSINGKTPIVINNNESIHLSNGDSINISHIEANYERGLSLDILDYGDLNDYRKDFRIFRNTSMIVRKDNYKFGEIPIKITGSVAEEQKETSGPDKIEYFVIETKGHQLLLSNGETLEMIKGDKMKIIDVFPSSLSGIEVNFKGFVGDKKNNTGEDRGYEIDTAKDLMKSYSINKDGEYYPIIVSQNDKEIGRIIIKLIPPKMHYLVLNVNDKRHLLLRSDDSISLSPKDNMFVEEIYTNLYSQYDIHLNINGHKIGLNELWDLKDLCTSEHNQLNIQQGSLILGRIFINMDVIVNAINK